MDDAADCNFEIKDVGDFILSTSNPPGIPTPVFTSIFVAGFNFIVDFVNDDTAGAEKDGMADGRAGIDRILGVFNPLVKLVVLIGNAILMNYPSLKEGDFLSR